MNILRTRNGEFVIKPANNVERTELEEWWLAVRKKLAKITIEVRPIDPQESQYKPSKGPISTYPVGV